jgi:UPF0755 protein
MLRFAIVSSFVMILGVAVAAVAAYLVWQSYGAPGPLTEIKTVIIQRGSGVDEIADQLAREGVIGNSYAFRIVTRIEGMSSRLKAGEFAFPAGASQRAVAEQIAAGRTVVRRLTIPEGLTTFQILALIRNAQGMDGDIGSTPQEGELFPDTYDYRWGDSRERFVQRLRRTMTETLNEVWNSRARELPLRGPNDAVILASIVERETALAAERPRVAAVYLNRLRRGMKLEADPTVIYGITQGRGTLDRPLSRADLQQRTQWNTYVVEGLPPTPIANPGRAALQAVLRPAQSDELFFVADGNGGHLFARTLQEHNANVARLRELERQRARAQGQPVEEEAPQQPQQQQRRPQQQQQRRN